METQSDLSEASPQDRLSLVGPRRFRALPGQSVVATPDLALSAHPYKKTSGCHFGFRGRFDTLRMATRPGRIEPTVGRSSAVVAVGQMRLKSLCDISFKRGRDCQDFRPVILGDKQDYSCYEFTELPAYYASLGAGQ